MSRFVQIDIRLLPIYGQGGLKNAFPQIFAMLDECGYDLVIKKEPSLYEMVDVLVRIGNDPHASKRARQTIALRLRDLEKLRDEARELLLSRRLNELDRVLYGLEDLFSELDGALG
ncbi:MAG: hypothetical protein LLG06_18485 [Desulfobacteraceae bacterium]|nr:hypothetical protein [Desulfobacteraceae bacterium]